MACHAWMGERREEEGDAGEEALRMEGEGEESGEDLVR